MRTKRQTDILVRVLTLVVLLSAPGCGGAVKRTFRSFTNDSSETETTSKTKGGAGPTTVHPEMVQVQTVGGEFVPEQGDPERQVDRMDMTKPQAQILDADALEQRIRTVFSVPQDVALFTQFARRELGTIVQIGSTGLWTNKWLDSLTQEYIRQLRMVIFDQCRALVEKEYTALAADPEAASTNLLVKNLEKPSPEDVNHFMSVMFGYSRIGELHEGAAAYAKVFSDNVAAYTDSDPDRFAKANYRILCLAIGQDMRVYLR